MLRLDDGKFWQSYKSWWQHIFTRSYNFLFWQIPPTETDYLLYNLHSNKFPIGLSVSMQNSLWLTGSTRKQGRLQMSQTHDPFNWSILQFRGLFNWSLLKLRVVSSLNKTHSIGPWEKKENNIDFNFKVHQLVPFETQVYIRYHDTFNWDILNSLKSLVDTLVTLWLKWSLDYHNKHLWYPDQHQESFGELTHSSQSWNQIRFIPHICHNRWLCNFFCQVSNFP